MSVLISLLHPLFLSRTSLCVPTWNDIAHGHNLHLIKEFSHPSQILSPSFNFLHISSFIFFIFLSKSSAFLPTWLSCHHSLLLPHSPSSNSSFYLAPEMLSFSLSPPPNSFSPSCSLRFLADRWLIFGPAMLESLMLFLWYPHSHQTSASFSQSWEKVLLLGMSLLFEFPKQTPNPWGRWWGKILIVFTTVTNMWDRHWKGGFDAQWFPFILLLDSLKLDFNWANNA